MDTLSEKIVKIRKPHRCFACSRKFEVGTMMRSQTHMYDGIMTVYSCATCDELMDKFHDQFFDDCELVYPASCVREAMSNCKASTPEELLTIMLSESNTQNKG